MGDRVSASWKMNPANFACWLFSEVWSGGGVIIASARTTLRPAPMPSTAARGESSLVARRARNPKVAAS